MQKILTLDIKCIRGMYLMEPYKFRTHAPAAWTLEDLERHILRTMDFDGDHMAQFHLAATARGRQTLLGPDDGADYADSMLEAIFPLPKHKKLFYLYDFGASWLFQISKHGKSIAMLRGVTYPRLISKEGVKPLEYGGDDDFD